MNKLLTISIASAAVAACGTKANTKGIIQNPINVSFKVEGALDTLERDGVLKSVKLVTDGGQVTDKGFNELIWKGVSDYTGTSSGYYAVPANARKTTLEATYTTSFETSQIVVAGGFQHNAAIADAAKVLAANKGFLYVDGQVKQKNVMSFVFNMEEVSFYAGYSASKYLSDNAKTFDVEGSEGLKLATFGGMNFPTVTGFMSGFQQGIAYWNENTPEDGKKVIFMSLGKKADSYFTGSFKEGGAKAISEKLINAGADIIMPVAGAQTLDLLEVIDEKGAKTLVIGVDTDQVTLFTNHEAKFFTSVLKKMDVAILTGIQHIYGEIEAPGYGLGETVVGSISNNLTGLASGGNNKLTGSMYNEILEDAKISAAAKKAKHIFRF